MVSERKARANRANARASTGPRTVAGKARAARNAKRHGLTLSALVDPAYADDIKACAKVIAGEGATAEMEKLACRIAAAQIDLKRIRMARRFQIASALNCQKEPADQNGNEESQGIASNRVSAASIQDPIKYAEILGGLADHLELMDRYERRALSRRKSAIRAFNATRTNY